MQTKILIPVLILFISTTASAQRSFYTVNSNNNRLPEKQVSFHLTVVPDRTSPSIQLYLDNPEQKKITLQIHHKENGLVVDTLITSDRYDRRYNFEQADDGHYLVTLICGKEKISKAVEISTITTRNVVVQ